MAQAKGGLEPVEFRTPSPKVGEPHFLGFGLPKPLLTKDPMFVLLGVAGTSANVLRTFSSLSASFLPDLWLPSETVERARSGQQRVFWA